jgi:CHASE2 domain-containing sensor protein
MNLPRFRNLGTYLVTAALVGLPIFPSLWLAATNWGEKLEKSTVDLRYVLSGHRKPSPQIVLMLEDEASQKRFKQLESSRGVIATLITQARAKGAKVIAVDFQFVRPRLAYEDSLLLVAVKGQDHVIVGCSYSNLAPPEKPENTVGQKDDSPECSVAEYPDFLVSPDSMMVMPQLLEAGARVAHVDVVFDPINGQAATVPLYINGDRRVPAFGLETVKIYFGISDNEIKIRGDKLVVLPAGYEPLRIPIMQTGEFLIDHLGNEDNFDYFSWNEVYDWASGLRPDSSDWTDKIVLIGSKLEDPEFPTPYATDFFLPGVLIHATVIDNILSGHFLRPLSPHAAAWLIIVCGLALFWLFSRLPPAGQVASILVMLGLFAGLAFGLFHYFRMLLPFTPVAFFVIMTAVLQGTKEWLANVRGKANLEKRLQRLELDIVQQMQQHGQRRPELPSFVFFVFSLERRDQSFFPHWLELRNNSYPGPFLPKIKPPLEVSNHAIHKLQLSIKHLQESYVNYVFEGTREENTPKNRMRKIGARLMDEFGLKPTFGELFAAGGTAVPLHLVLSNLKLPWTWAYHAPADKFLCEGLPWGFRLPWKSMRFRKTPSPRRSARRTPPMAPPFFFMAIGRDIRKNN